jgi:hypothetical protein
MPLRDTGVWTFPRTDFGPRPTVLARNLVDAAEVHAGKPQLAANEEQPSLPMSADLSKASAVECILSRRDSLIVARHEYPFSAVSAARRGHESIAQALAWV